MPSLVENFFANPTGSDGHHQVLAMARGWQGVAAGRRGARHRAVFRPGHELRLRGLYLSSRTDGPLWLGLARRLFSEFEKSRKADTDAIADLAIENFVEMRDRVADPRFLFRKKVELELEKKYPGRFVPKYAMVTFHRTPYSVAAARGAIQDRMLGELCDSVQRVEDIDWTKAEALDPARTHSAGRSVNGGHSLRDVRELCCRDGCARSPGCVSRAVSYSRPHPTAARRFIFAAIRSDCSRNGRASTSSRNFTTGRQLGVEAHFHGRNPWMPYHRLLTENMAGMVGAQPDEVVVMNSLTANLHLMMVSFYRPTPQRHKIVIEAGAFPSDRYAVESQLRFHGLRSGEVTD